MNRLGDRHLAAQMMAHTAARARPAELGREDEAIAAPLPGDEAQAIALPPPARIPARALSEVIASRRSGRISERAIDAAQLAALLGAFEAELPGALLPAPLLAPLAFPVALAVEGVPPAAYRYDAREHRLVPVRAVERARFAREVLLQWEHGRAAAVIFTVLPLGAWLRHAGDRGYRAAALQAGWIADRLYLIAESLGLSYSASGGYSPFTADPLLGLDGVERTAFFSFIAGGPRR